MALATITVAKFLLGVGDLLSPAGPFPLLLNWVAGENGGGGVNNQHPDTLMSLPAQPDITSAWYQWHFGIQLKPNR